MSLYIDERRGVQANTSMKWREFPRELPRPNAGIFLYSQLKSMYRHYSIFESDEALAIAIAIYIAISVSKATIKKEPII